MFFLEDSLFSLLFTSFHYKSMTVHIRTRLAHNMIRLREVQHLTQQELANIVGISRQTISETEREQCNLSIDTIQRIADAFNIDITKLLKDRISNRVGWKQILEMTKENHDN